MSLPALSAPRKSARSDRKKAAIIAAATQVFLRDGYGQANMDSIAQAAGVSKQTIYHHFGNKSDLFGAIIRSKCDQLLEPLEMPSEPGMKLEAALTSVARQFIDIMLAPSSLALHRVLMGEVQRFPELGRMSYKIGPARIVATIAAYLRQQASEGRLDLPDPEFAAEQFYAMLTGHLQLRALLGVEATPSREQIERIAKHAVDTTLSIYAPR
jgi:TetR/AcrR family transcriptional repressor of mexJK operon